MNALPHLLVHDIGTTAIKTTLFKLEDRLRPLASALKEYQLFVLEHGAVEQDAEQWWVAACQGTREVLAKSRVSPMAVRGMAFGAQMQGFVPVDAQGAVLRRPMSYMDSRAAAQIDANLYRGLIRIGKWNARQMVDWLRITGGAAASVKDPLWKYLWFKENEPRLYSALHAWLDVKDYMVLRATGEYSMGQDSAHATFLFDTRAGRMRWHAGLCRRYGVDLRHLPRVVQATDRVGGLSAVAARDMGLPEGLPVFGGGGDLSMISLGSGCHENYQTHIYIGTSGWVVSQVDRRLTDLRHMVASILGAIPGRFNYISELETAGRCLQWVRDHLALDEIGLYLHYHPSASKEQEYTNLYHYLSEVVATTEPGANGVLFAPWLHGCRSPFDDPHARGMFVNLGLNTRKRDLIRAVLEGVGYSVRSMLEAVETKVPRQTTLRFVGGGAQSDVWAQILADISGRQIEVIEDAQNAGTIGAAMVCAVGLGLTNFARASSLIAVRKAFMPRPEYRGLYDRNYRLFSLLHRQNQKVFRGLNA